jgi:aldose 1-epimerase
MVSRVFGRLPGGEEVEAWTLHGRGGLVVEVITYGAIITQILVPQKNANPVDVVLGFNGLEPYLSGCAYMGAAIGRVAGRISGAAFELEGKRYRLAANDPPHHLHGGVHGFDKKLWMAKPDVSAQGAPGLVLTCESRDGEEGYPGTVRIKLRYTVDSDNVLSIETESITDQPTPLSLTFHSYFNLAGEACGGDVLSHELQVNSGKFIATDESMGLIGKVASVAGRPNDFRRSRSLATTIPQLFKRHGDLYCLRASRSSHPTPAARLAHPASGRVLEVSTTATHLQLYTGVSLDGSLLGKSGKPYGPHAGLCLECEGYPDGPNAPACGDIILRPDQPRHEITTYAFSMQSRS